jgi:hypothetical protein
MATDFGSDLSTFTSTGEVDIDPLFASIDGPRAVLEDCARRLMTPAGFFPRYPDFGFDLRAKLASRINAVTRMQIGNSIEAELLKEERVLQAKVVEFIEDPPRSNSWRIRISITLAEGPFVLVLQASQLNVTVLETSKG